MLSAGPGGREAPPRILVVDDTPANVHILTARLAAHGYDIVTASDGEEALAAVPAAGVLRVDPRDVELARGIVQELGARLELEPELDTLGGVEVSAGGGLTVRNTLEERLRNAEAELRVLAGELLEPASALVAAGHAL